MVLGYTLPVKIVSIALDEFHSEVDIFGCEQIFDDELDLHFRV